MNLSLKLSVLLLSLGLPLHSFAYEVTCPSEIETSQKLRTSKEKIWEEFYPAKNLHKFKGLEVFDGHPKEMASLAPPVWEAPLKGFWVSCKYVDTSTRLIQRVPSQYKKCSMGSKETILKCE